VQDQESDFASLSTQSLFSSSLQNQGPTAHPIFIN